MKKAALHNLGCKVNAYETEAMQQILENAGYEIVPFTEIADVYVINTCSVTNMADRKSRQMFHRAKKMNPDAIVVGAGCYVQTKEAQAIADKLKDVTLELKAKAGQGGRLFGSVTSKEIAAEIKKQYNFSIDKRKISLDCDIKAFGVYNCEIKLFGGVVAKLKVSVTEL